MNKKVATEQFKQLATSRAPQNRKFLNGLKRRPLNRMDEAFQRHHAAVFAETDCLQCANCCKTTSPVFAQADIERLSRNLKMRPGEFIDKYLRLDEDQDYVLKTAPCPFLQADNRCAVYDDRPKACREYPHTNRKNMAALLDLTYRNTLVCPAVLEIVERLRMVEPGR